VGERESSAPSLVLHVKDCYKPLPFFEIFDTTFRTFKVILHVGNLN